MILSYDIGIHTQLNTNLLNKDKVEEKKKLHDHTKTQPVNKKMLLMKRHVVIKGIRIVLLSITSHSLGVQNLILMSET